MKQVTEKHPDIDWGSVQYKYQGYFYPFLSRQLRLTQGVIYFHIWKKKLHIFKHFFIIIIFYYLCRTRSCGSHRVQFLFHISRYFIHILRYFLFFFWDVFLRCFSYFFHILRFFIFWDIFCRTSSCGSDRVWGILPLFPISLSNSSRPVGRIYLGKYWNIK